MSITNRTKKHQSLQRLSTFSLDEVLPHIGNPSRSFNGKRVRLRSQKYRVFKEKGTACVICGLRGSFFALEKLPDAGKHHFNLYGVDKQGHEVLMTIDHIIPKSKGGESVIENYEPMCKVCNERKGDRLPNLSPIIASRFYTPEEDEFNEIRREFRNQNLYDLVEGLSQEEIQVAYGYKNRSTKCMVIIQTFLYDGVSNQGKLEALKNAIKSPPYNF